MPSIPESIVPESFKTWVEHKQLMPEVMVTDGNGGFSIVEEKTAIIVGGTYPDDASHESISSVADGSVWLPEFVSLEED